MQAATTIADWGGNYTTTGDQAFATPTAVSSGTNMWTYKYSASAAISPSSGYTAPSGKSGTFYGALQVNNTEATNATDAWEITPRIINNGAADRIGIRSDDLAVSGQTSAVVGLIFFKKSDFLNSMSNTSSIQFDSSSEFKMTLVTQVGNLRLAVLDGTQWYLSSYNRTSGGSGSLTLSNLVAENFGAWNITTSSAPLPAVPGSFTTAGSTFTDIQGVGFYFDGSTTSTGVSPGVQVTAFSVTAIPEPAPTIAVLVLTAISCVSLVGKRRFRWFS